MLPLLSMTMHIDTGTSSRLNSLISCSTPFSVTLKFVLGRSGDHTAVAIEHADIQRDLFGVGRKDRLFARNGRWRRDNLRTQGTTAKCSREDLTE